MQNNYKDTQNNYKETSGPQTGTKQHKQIQNVSCVLLLLYVAGVRGPFHICAHEPNASKSVHENMNSL